MLLEVRNLKAAYGKKLVLRDVSLQVGRGDVVAIIGANGAGKSTALRAIFGFADIKGGKIIFNGRDVTGQPPTDKVSNGISYVFQGHRVFSNLSVEENLRMGGYTVRDRRGLVERQSEILELFPVLAERKKQAAGTLSGGERQMLAISMSLMQRPKLMLVDEPSTGLAPFLVAEVLQRLKQISVEVGTSLLIVEQNVRQVLNVSDKVYVMKLGRTTAVGSPERFRDEEELRKAFLADATVDG